VHRHDVNTRSRLVLFVSVSPVTAARELGVYIDAGVTMRTQVINTVRACFAALRQIRSVRRSLPQHALLTLIRTLVITKLDNCNSVLVGTSVYLQDRLPDVRTHNSTVTGASLVTRPERIQFRLCVPAYHCVHGTPPAYLSHSLRPTSEIVARRCLRSADTTTLQVPSTRRATLGDRAFPVTAARA